MVCKCGHIFRETSQLPSSTLHSALFGVIIDLYLLLLRWYTACLCLGVFDVIRRKRASAADVECNAVFLSNQNKFTSGVYCAAFSVNRFEHTVLYLMFNSQLFRHA